MANTLFNEYLNSLTPSKRTIAAEAVEVYLKGESQKPEQIRCAVDIWEATRFLATKEQEHVVGIFLNARNKIKEIKEIATGGICNCLVDMKILLREALMCNAVCVVLVHNHPSGDPKPSREDDELTSNFKKACLAIQLKPLDHVIVAGNNYYSYSENGKI